MNCANCNAELEPGAKFCDSCGAPVAQDVTIVPEAASASELPGEPSPAEPASASELPGEAEPPASAAPAAAPTAYIPRFEIPEAPPPPEAVRYENAPSTENNTTGIISLVLGIGSLIFSCVGCGGLLGLGGLIAGFLSLKTSGRSMGIAGLITSGLGLLISLVFLCIIAFALVASWSTSYSY